MLKKLREWLFGDEQTLLLSQYIQLELLARTMEGPSPEHDALVKRMSAVWERMDHETRDRFYREAP